MIWILKGTNKCLHHLAQDLLMVLCCLTGKIPFALSGKYKPDDTTFLGKSAPKLFIYFSKKSLSFYT